MRFNLEAQDEAMHDNFCDLDITQVMDEILRALVAGCEVSVRPIIETVEE